MSKTEKGAKHHVHVFVYGTLKKKQGNHCLMQRINAQFVGYDTISGPYNMISYGGFPAVCHDSSVDGASTIFGELYRIDQEGLKVLDGLEGHPRWYKREKLCTDYKDQRAWIYLMPESELVNERVPCNMWRPTTEAAEFWATKGEEIAA